MGTTANEEDARHLPRIIIIGSGFGGLCMAIRLKQAGLHNFLILEQSAQPGGTWRDNAYPGAACDVPSHLYSFSFEPKPDWTRHYAPQQEILAYTQHCIDKYGLRAHLRCNAKVTAANFVADSGRWQIQLADGSNQVADIVVSASGGLSRPAYPNISGLSRFAGKLFHSAQWDHNFDFNGKTVAVIGTGASAIQFVPQIAPQVKQLALFQRTPPWVLPKPDRAIPALERSLYRRVPLLQRLHRQLIYWHLEGRALGFVVNPKIMRMAQWMGRQHLRKHIVDPVLRTKLTPDYVMGCKRVLMSNDYYPTLARPNVRVVTEAIREMVAEGIVTSDGKLHQVDAVILGTGFQAGDAVAPFSVHGINGADLNLAWRDGAEAYLGTSVHGFPNLFLIVGPNTGLGHSSMIYMIEAQVQHVMACLDALRSNGARQIEVKAEVQQRYNHKLQTRLAKSVWASGCSSWYQNSAGRNTTLWPGFTFKFRQRVATLRDGDYRFDN